jgi:hypothetical protein
MEVVLNTGANLNNSIEWHSINWKDVYENVRRLQARIVKAFKEGKRRKVRALQIILTRSFSGKAISVRRVTENQGIRLVLIMRSGIIQRRRHQPLAALNTRDTARNH